MAWAGHEYNNKTTWVGQKDSFEMRIEWKWVFGADCRETIGRRYPINRTIISEVCTRYSKKIGCVRGGKDDYKL